MLDHLIRRTLKGAAMTCAALHDMLDRTYPLDLIQHECARMIRAGTLSYRRNHLGLAEVYRPDAPPRPAGISAHGEPERHPTPAQAAPRKKHLRQLDVLRYISAHPRCTNQQIANAHGCTTAVVSATLSCLTHTHRIEGIEGTSPRQYRITTRGQRQLTGNLTANRWTDNLIRSSQPKRIGRRNAVHVA